MSINEQIFGDRPSGDDTSHGTGEGTVRPVSLASGPDSSQAAARLLEMTARETDQWRSEARGEAAAIVAGARGDAAELVRNAHEEAERMVTSAREEASQMVNDARIEAYRMREETTAVRQRHEEQVAHLQQMATQHREQLRQHLTEMLDRVDATPDTGGA